MEDEILILHEQVKKETGLSDLALEILFVIFAKSRAEENAVSAE